MDSGFGINLEGLLIKSNLSVLPNEYDINIANGSLEVCGNLYADIITPFTNTTSGSISVNNVEFNSDNVYIPFNTTNPSVIVDGILHLNNTSTSLTLDGSADIMRNLTVHGNISADLNRILLVADPIDGKDAVNLDYLDYRLENLNIISDLFPTQVIFCGNTSGLLSGTNYFTYETSSNTLNLYNINVNTINSSYGSIGIDTQIDMNGNVIGNALDPVLPQDVATKNYVDTKSPNADASAGQLIIMGTDGSTFIGYQELVFSQTSGSSVFNVNGAVDITNTVPNLGFGSGGSLNVLGGCNVSGESFFTNIDAGMNNITSVDSPIQEYDAVNKAYVHNILDSRSIKITNYVIENNITELVAIPNFRMDISVVAVITYIHIKETVSGMSSLYVLNAWRTDTGWDSNIVDVFMRISGVSFSISTGSEWTSLMYTNANTSGNYVIDFYNVSEVFDAVMLSQTSITLSSEYTVDYGDVPINLTDISAVEYTVYLNDYNNNYGMITLNCSERLPRLPKSWYISYINYGDITGIAFRITADGSLQYTNNYGRDVSVIIAQSYIQDSQYTLVLQPTITPTIIQDTHLEYPDNLTFIRNTVYVSVPDTDKSAMFFLEGYYDSLTNGWYLNSRFIGDYTGVKFYMTTLGGVGHVQYTNINSSYAVLKFGLVKYDTIAPVTLGGTGSGWLEPNCVLRGNGIDPIVATTDFMYTSERVLSLGTESSIHLYNVSNGSLICDGGASVKRLSINNVSVAPNPDDILEELYFEADNNVSEFTNITGLLFSNSRAFDILMRVEILTSTGSLEALYSIKGLKRVDGIYRMNISTFGDNTGINLTVSDGNIQYKSSNIPNWLSTTFYFTATTLKTF